MNAPQSYFMLTLLFVLGLPAFVQGAKDTHRDSSLATVSAAGELGNIEVYDTHLIESLSKKELEWYNKFQDGTLFFDGWKNISNTILASLPTDEQTNVKKVLDNMGMRIGVEWSKKNSTRKIDNDKLRHWGDRLKQAQAAGAANLKETVQNISNEVDAILQKQ